MAVYDLRSSVYGLKSTVFSLKSPFLQFQFVKILPKHAGSLGDGDEGAFVDLLDDAGDAYLVGFVGHNEQHVALLAVVGAVALEEGSSAVQVAVNAVGNLLVLLREDHELVGLAVAVDHDVGDEHIDEEDHEAIDQLLHVVEDEEGASDDEEVGGDVDLAVGDVAVLADHEGDDVEATGVAAPVDGDAHAGGRDGRADDDAHEHVIDERVRENLLGDAEKEGQDGGADDGVDAEAGAQDFPRHGDEDAVEHKGCEADGDGVVGEIDQCGDAGHAAACHLERCHECGPSEHKNCQTQRDEEVVFNLLPYLVTRKHSASPPFYFIMNQCFIK